MGTYPEYQNRSLLSILAELQALVPPDAVGPVNALRHNLILLASAEPESSNRDRRPAAVDTAYLRAQLSELVAARVEWSGALTHP